MTDEQKLERAGWKNDGASWKRGRHAAMRDGFGWMIYLGTDCVWNNDTLPGWAGRRPGDEPDTPNK